MDQYTYVVTRIQPNGQSVVEITTDDPRFANEWVKERKFAIDGVVTEYQVLKIPFAMPDSAVTGSGVQYY